MELRGFTHRDWTPPMHGIHADRQHQFTNSLYRNSFPYSPPSHLILISIFPMDTLVIAQGLDPWLFFFLQLATTIYTLGFTVPSSIIRPAVLPVQVTCCFIICINIKDHITRLGWAASRCFLGNFCLPIS